LQDNTHYLRLASSEAILFAPGQTKLPSWFIKSKWDKEFQLFKRSLFKNDSVGLVYSKEWINQRLKSIEVGKKLTDEWENRGIQKGQEFAILTDEITKAWSGYTTKRTKCVIRQLDFVKCTLINGYSTAATLRMCDSRLAKDVSFLASCMV
jgi:hypothetical protein